MVQVDNRSGGIQRQLKRGLSQCPVCGRDHGDEFGIQRGQRFLPAHRESPRIESGNLLGRHQQNPDLALDGVTRIVEITDERFVGGGRLPAVAGFAAGGQSIRRIADPIDHIVGQFVQQSLFDQGLDALLNAVGHLRLQRLLHGRLQLLLKHLGHTRRNLLLQGLDDAGFKLLFDRIRQGGFQLMLQRFADGLLDLLLDLPGDLFLERLLEDLDDTGFDLIVDLPVDEVTKRLCVDDAGQGQANADRDDRAQPGGKGFCRHGAQCSGTVGHIKDNGPYNIYIPRQGIKWPGHTLSNKGTLNHELREAMLEALPRVRRFACGLTGNRHDADDLLQATVERVLQRGLPGDAEVLKWMMRVCRNLWIDELRSRDVRHRAASAMAHEQDPCDTPANPDGEMVNALYLRQVDAVINMLPEEQRAVLSLVAVEGFSYRETAEVLDIPIGTVMSRLARARAAIAARMSGESAQADRTPEVSDEN